MNGDNDYFHVTDNHVNHFGDIDLPIDWWSRKVEYPWVIQFTHPDFVVADMGCGWMNRPLKDELAKACKTVYAVDMDARVLSLEVADNIILVNADMTKVIPELPLLDRIFCISVLEELPIIDTISALCNFRKLLKANGKIIITFDTPYDKKKTCDPYPGKPLHEFIMSVAYSGLRFVGDIETNKDAIVYQMDWNLACYHCILEANE